jgi:hypothetical protein
VRGQPDSEVVKRLIAVADSRFQDELVKQAKAHGKLERDYEVPERYRHNLPEALEEKLHPWAEAGLLPDFPFGTDLTADEIAHRQGAEETQARHAAPGRTADGGVQELLGRQGGAAAYLERLGWPTRTASRTR